MTWPWKTIFWIGTGTIMWRVQADNGFTTLSLLIIGSPTDINLHRFTPFTSSEQFSAIFKRRTLCTMYIYVKIIAL
jgi:hypothetical protein